MTRADPQSRRPAPIDLAPQHKLGLTLANPVMLAAGVAGYGDALGPGGTLEGLGALVTAPVTRHAWRRRTPRLWETPEGVLWQRGWWNPGVGRVVRDFAGLWQRSPAPVIVHVAGAEPDELAAVAGRLEDLPGVAGLEVDVPADAAITQARIWAVREAADLPLLARLPLAMPDAAVQGALDAGADALVVAQPPTGLCLDPTTGQPERGDLYGPALAPQVAARLAELAAWVKAPLVACGGVFALEHALTALAAGAVAVQVDLAVWIDPSLPGRLATALAGRQVSP